jgi:hypothetical protein
VRPWRLSSISQGSRGKKATLDRRESIRCRPHTRSLPSGVSQNGVAIAERYPRCSARRFVVASEGSSTQGSTWMRGGGMEGMLDSRNIVRAQLKRTDHPVRKAV